MTSFQSLPLEVKTRIFEHLDPVDLPRVLSLVSWSFYESSNVNLLWKKCTANLYGGCDVFQIETNEYFSLGKYLSDCESFIPAEMRAEVESKIPNGTLPSLVTRYMGLWKWRYFKLINTPSKLRTLYVYGKLFTNRRDIVWLHEPFESGFPLPKFGTASALVRHLIIERIVYREDWMPEEEALGDIWSEGMSFTLRLPSSDWLYSHVFFVMHEEFLKAKIILVELHTIYTSHTTTDTERQKIFEVVYSWIINYDLRKKYNETSETKASWSNLLRAMNEKHSCVLAQLMDSENNQINHTNITLRESIPRTRTSKKKTVHFQMLQSALLEFRTEASDIDNAYKSIESNPSLGPYQSILSIPPRILAEQLTLTASVSYHKIETSEFLHQRWVAEPDKAPNLRAFIGFSQRLKHWISVLVLFNAKTKAEKCSMLSYIVVLLQSFILIRNYSATRAVISGLEYSAVKRLSSLWETIPEYHKQYIQINEAFNLLSNDLLSQAESPCIACLPTNHLLFYNDLPGQDAKKRIHFAKYFYKWRTCSKVLRHQRKRFQFDENLEVQKFVLNEMERATHFSTQMLTQQSFLFSPRIMGYD